MKILTAKEYKEKNPEAYLNDYINYLEEQQKEAETVLESAKSLALSEDVLKQIEAQSREITHILELIETRLGQIILNTVDHLSLEELQAYFDYSVEQKEQEEKKAELEAEKQELEEALSKVNDEIEANLIQNGRSRELYDQTNIGDFFDENITPVQLYSNLLSGNVTEFLHQDIKKALEIECKIQNITLSEKELEKLATQFVSLIRESQKILEYSEDAKEQLAQNLMTENGFLRILPPDFDKQTPIFIAYDFMSFSKTRTYFYDILPPTLQQTLTKERFIGETYESLKRTYEAYQNGDETANEDLNEKERKEKARLEEQLSKVNYDITCLDTKIEARNNFLSDEDALRSVLKAAIEKQLERSQISTEEIRSVVVETEDAANALKAQLVSAYEEYMKKTEMLIKARTILISSSYDSFFYAVDQNNTRRIYKAFGVMATEKVVEPFVGTEQRRLEQLQIMVAIQNELERIGKAIKEKKANSNFITRQFSAYRDSLNRLEAQFNQAKTNGFQKLQSKQLCYIYAPKISCSIMEDGVCLMPNVVTIDPQSFEELRERQQGFWDLSTGIDKNTQRKYLENNLSFVDWDGFAKDLMQRQEELVTKLFDFEKEEDFNFHFSITPEERKTLLKIQQTILDIAESVYEERRNFRQCLGTHMNVLDEKKKAELEAILGKGSNLCRENLATYIENTEEELAVLKKLLFGNRALCGELSLELPEESPVYAETENDLEVRIRNLNIEGIETLQQARFYLNLLSELDTYTVSKEGIKTFCLEHHVKVK